MNKDYLNWWIWSVIMGFAILAACWWTVWEEIDKQCPEEKEVKVYTGEWVEDIVKVDSWWSVGYLELEVEK